MTQAPRAGVDHDADRALRQSHLRGRGPVVDAIHGLHLEEMVAGTQAADLPEPAFDRPVTDRRRIGSVEHAAVFAPLQVPCDAVSLLHREAGTTGEDLLQRAAVRQPPHALGADSARYRRDRGGPSPHESVAAIRRGPTPGPPAAAPRRKCRIRLRRGRRHRRHQCPSPPRHRSETRIPSARRASQRRPGRSPAASPRWPPEPEPCLRVRRAAARGTRTRSRHPHGALLFDPEPVWSLLDQLHLAAPSDVKSYRASPAIAAV